MSEGDDVTAACVPISFEVFVRELQDSLPIWMSKRQMVRSFFRSDPRVLAFASGMAETPEKVSVVLDRMWDRDECGWGSESKARVQAMVDEWLSESKSKGPAT